MTLEINANGAHSIGLDLDRDHLTGVFVNLSGAVRQRLHAELSVPEPDESVDLMVKTTRAFIDQQSRSLDAVRDIGVRFPGPIEVATRAEGITSVHPKVFPGWDDVPIIALLQRHIDLPILLENNATDAALVFGGRLPDPLLNALLHRLEEQLPTLRTDGMPAHAHLRRSTARPCRRPRCSQPSHVQPRCADPDASLRKTGRSV